MASVEDYRRIVYSHQSDLHRGTDQLVFMPDPNDPTFTIVRYMSAVTLTDWRAKSVEMASGS